MDNYNGSVGSTALTVAGTGGMRVAREIALEPQTISDALSLCKALVASGMLPKAIQRPEQALVVLMKGRELGLSVMQSFACINVIEGKAALSAELLVAKAKQSPACEYFRFVKGDDKAATFETKRKGEPSPTLLTFTIEQAAAMNLASRDNWKKQPATMLRWRAATALARLVYPEETLGLYSTDEAADIVQRSAPTVQAEYVPATEEQEQAAHDKVAEFLTAIAAAPTTADLQRVGEALAKEPGPIREAVRSDYSARMKTLKAKPVPVVEREPGSDDGEE